MNKFFSSHFLMTLSLFSIFLFGCARETKSSALVSKDFYIWDNWVLSDEGKLHRYFLAASKKYTLDERHEHAYIRHAVSVNKAKSWNDLGAVLKPTKDASWPDLVVWSGSAVKKDDEILLFVTGRSKEDGLLQKIGLARSSDAHKFSKIKLILEPTEAFNYDISDDDGVIMAWRDPFVFYDAKTKLWHMFFAAKQKLNGKTIAAIGHAISLDEKLEKWNLLKPLKLSETFAQIEVPNLVYKDGLYYLFVSVQYFPQEKTNLKKKAELRAYTAKDINDNWELLIEPISGHEFYATTIFKNQEDDYGAVAFWSEDQAQPISGTAPFQLKWDKHKPYLVKSSEADLPI